MVENSENFQAGGVNFVSLISEGLSDEAYQMWLKADEEALKIKMDISKMKSNCGKNKVFSFAITAVI